MPASISIVREKQADAAHDRRRHAPIQETCSARSRVPASDIGANIAVNAAQCQRPPGDHRNSRPGAQAVADECGLACCHPAKLRHFRDQHGCRDRADTRYGSQEPCLCGRCFLLRDDAFDPSLKVIDLRVQHGMEVRVPAFDIGGDALLPARRDPRQKPFAHIDELRPSRRQSPENTQVLARQDPSGLWPEQREPGDEPRIDPVRLCPSVSRKGDGLDLSRGQSHSFDPCRDKRDPKCPFLTAAVRESDPHCLQTRF